MKIENEYHSILADDPDNWSLGKWTCTELLQRTTNRKRIFIARL